MSSPPDSDPTDVRWLAKADLSLLFAALVSRGYEVVGPTVAQGAIVYDRLNSVDDLPRGWTEVQGPASYRLVRRDDDALFGFVVGPHSWKQFLFPASATVATADRDGDGWQMQTPTEPQPKYAFLGVRACELAAIDVQDRVFLEGPYVDPIYAARRRQALIIAVNCTQAATTCFCTSMNTGPRCRAGFDLALTELPDGFIVEVGSDAGSEILGRAAASNWSRRRNSQAAEAARQQAVDQITRRLDTDGHPRSAAVEPGASALGRGRPALPVVHELHDGLPDLFLQLGQGSCRLARATTSSGSGNGIRVSTSTSAT